MKLFIFSVHDKAVNAFLPPFMMRSKGEAIRSFTDACASKEQNFSKYPLDYTLVELGSFEDSNGLFETYEPMRIVSANEVMPNDVFPPEAEIKSATNGRRLPM